MCPVSKELAKSGIEEVVVNTGQHYDDNMSTIFFDQLQLKKPKYNLGVGSGSHAEQTAKMLIGIEHVLAKEKPDAVLVYGDTNSTLAGVLTAAKLNVPCIHVEAGLRSFNKAMPEEVNRIVADQLSDILFCPTKTAVNNLANEGRKKDVFLVGDVMYDASLQNLAQAEKQSTILTELRLSPGAYYLVTVHRQENTNDVEKLRQIVDILSEIEETVVFPLHPRTKKALDSLGLREKLTNVKIIDPVSYFDMIVLEKNARIILTDSGGVQKEAYFYQVPCITLRDETEWTETVTAGWNVLTGANTQKVLKALENTKRPKKQPAFYGKGDAAEKIAKTIRKILLR